MRRYIKYVSSLLFILLLSINAYAASPSISGPSVIRAGDQVTLSLQLEGKGFYGFGGSITYDSSKLVLTSVTTNLNGWKLDINNNKFVAYDDTLTNPINGTKTVLVAKFKVSNNITTGSSIVATIDGLLATDGDNEITYSKLTYSSVISAPKSNDASIANLNVSNATISPQFSSSTANYNATVDYSVTSLNISVTTNSQKASYKIAGNNLIVGSNKVSINVTAENGATKSYVLSVTRKPDPNYVPSNNALVSNVTISEGIISPIFSSEIDNYIIYVTNKTSEITLGGVPVDNKAKKIESILYNIDDNNLIILTCEAEDGTKKEYKFNIFKLPEFDGSIPIFNENSEVPTIDISGHIEIEGTPNVGETLRIKPKLSPDGANISYAWYVAGERVGEGEIYNVSTSDIGKNITVLAIGIGEYSGEIVSTDEIIAYMDNDNESSYPIHYNDSEKDNIFIIVLITSVIALALGILISYFINKRSKKLFLNISSIFKPYN